MLSRVRPYGLGCAIERTALVLPQGLRTCWPLSLEALSPRFPHSQLISLVSACHCLEQLFLSVLAQKVPSSTMFFPVTVHSVHSTHSTWKVHQFAGLRVYCLNSPHPGRPR